MAPILFQKNDFKDIWLKFDENFIVSNENAIYFGPNGIGKTTIYKAIKQNHPYLGYFSYDDCKDKVLSDSKKKENKKIIISVRTVDIEKLNDEKQKLMESLSIIENGFKKFGITSSQKAKNYSQYCKDVYDNNEKGIINFHDDKLELLLNYPDGVKKTFILENLNKLINLKLLEDDINKIKDKLILGAFESLEKAIDENETTCLLCGYDHKRSILEIYKERKKLFEDNLNELIDNYRIISNKNKEQIEQDLKEMIGFVVNNKITEENIVNYIIIGGNHDRIQEILNGKNQMMKINDKIIEYEKEREKFFETLNTNWDKIGALLNKIFKHNIEFEIDKDEKNIILKLKRDTKSYSVGELNYIIFLINILEFEYSDKSTIVIDDPLSSYDVKKQYEIVFDIFSRLINKGKTVVIFTHNVNLINIANSQRTNVFKYKSIEMINNTLYVNDIKFNKQTDSILNVENLLLSIEDHPLKPWLQLLVEKDDWKTDEEKQKCKVFHYDEPYCIDTLNLCNDHLVELINNFDANNFPTNSFLLQSLYKIVYLTALRVWLEKQMLDNLTVDVKNKFKEKETLYKKIKYYFNHKEKWIYDYEMEQEDLARKKVLLNENSHYKSQILPFHYALSISGDDLIKEVKELQDLFRKVSIPN